MRPGICEVTGGPGYIDSEYCNRCLCMSPFCGLTCQGLPAWRNAVAPLIGVPPEVAAADAEWHRQHMEGGPLDDITASKGEPQ